MNFLAAPTGFERVMLGELILIVLGFGALEIVEMSGGPKGGNLKGGHSKMGSRTEGRTRHVDFALEVALNTSILVALSKAI